MGASEHLGITLLKGKFVKMRKKFATFVMLLDGHKASFNNFFDTFKRKQCI